MAKTFYPDDRTIVYVNFPPYENAGKIFDYIRDRFRTVIVYSFNFHRLSPDQKQSRLTVYQKGKALYQTKLFQTPTTTDLAFILLPIRSVVLFLQLIFHTVRLQKKYGKPDLFFTVNAFTAWCGNILRRMGFVGRTVFWVWDYYPPFHTNRIVQFMRSLYWLFDKPASLESDRVVFLNKRLKELRQEMGILPTDESYPVVAIGTDPTPPKSLHELSNSLHIVFLGVLKKIQGLDLFFDAAKKLSLSHPDLTLHVIGGGPDEMYFKKREKTCPLIVKFHGYVQDEKEVDAIIAKCHIGIAPYIPDKSNVMFYSDPSKIKRYLNFGLPVITTDVFEFSRQIGASHAGEIISYDVDSFVKAFKKISDSYAGYAIGSTKLAKNFSYKILYANLFDF